MGRGIDDAQAKGPGTYLGYQYCSWCKSEQSGVIDQTQKSKHPILARHVTADINQHAKLVRVQQRALHFGKGWAHRIELHRLAHDMNAAASQTTRISRCGL